MSTDHDGLYDLRDLQDSDAWFTDAATRSLGTADPLSPSVIAMLERLDRELATLAPVDRDLVTALITGPTEAPSSSEVPRGPRRSAVRHVRRNLIVVGVTGALLVAAGGVAAASPGSFFYPVREATLGSADDPAAGGDLAAVESELDRIEVRIGEAQQAGGISEAARTSLARRMGAIHPIVERASGDRAQALLDRWTRDDLVLIALPHLADPEPSVVPTLTPTVTAAPTPPPDGSTEPAPTPSMTPSHDGASGRSTPRAHPPASPDPRSSHSAGTGGDAHRPTTPAPKPSPSASHHEGDQHPTSTPAPEPTKAPGPTTTATSGTDGSGAGHSQHNHG